MFSPSKLWLVAEFHHYVAKTHITLTTHLLYCNMLCMMKIVFVGFLPDGHGRSFETHPYGCGNVFIESIGNGVGRLVVVGLHLVEKTNLAVYEMKDNRTDG
jgi:hypothetical protein